MSINMADLDHCISELEKVKPETKYSISAKEALELCQLAKIGLYHVRKDYLTQKALEPNSPLAPAYFDADGLQSFWVFPSGRKKSMKRR